VVTKCTLELVTHYKMIWQWVELRKQQRSTLLLT